MLLEMDQIFPGTLLPLNGKAHEIAANSAGMKTRREHPEIESDGKLKKRGGRKPLWGFGVVAPCPIVLR